MGSSRSPACAAPTRPLTRPRLPDSPAAPSDSAGPLIGPAVGDAASSCGGSAGTRSLFRRRSRTLLAIISLALAVALGAAALATQRTFEMQLGHTGPSTGNTGAALQAIADRAAAARIRTLVDLFAVAFAVVAVVNLIIAAIFAARDSAPNRAVLRALGFTPTQTAATLVSSQTAAGIIACLIGAPLGIGIFHGVYAATNNSAQPPSNPPALSLAALVAAALVLTALLAAAAAQRSTRLPVTANLTTD